MRILPHCQHITLPVQGTIDKQTLFILITILKTQTVLAECSFLQW